MSVYDASAPLDRVLGGKSAGALNKAFGITTVGEFTRHYPRRYVARGELTDMNTLVDGDAVTILAEVVSVTTRPMQQRRGTIVEVVISDGVATPGKYGSPNLSECSTRLFSNPGETAKSRSS